MDGVLFLLAEGLSGWLSAGNYHDCSHEVTRVGSGDLPPPVRAAGPTGPMIASQLDGRRLRKGLSRLKPAALGLDRWSLVDLCSLLDRLLSWLADLLREVELLGKWPARLAEGYTALIPKEGSPGPPNTRPLTVLSMVYRPWAGVRLADTIAWQESGAHPAAFGFRLAGSSLDGAAGTQVLVEPCHLWRWAVAGMSIDYVKCFNLIPQAVLLPLALELGMDRGTCRALGAMLKQLHRAFKVAGALGCWWCATNGILQCRPMSVILVNVLTTISKWEVDSLHCQVCAQTAALPPVLDEEAAVDLEVGAPLLLKDAGPGYAALGSSGYADDTQAVALGAVSLRGAVPTTEEWLQVTGQDVRVDKFCSWVQGERGAPAVPLRGGPIPLADTFRQLGADVAIGGSRAMGPVLSRRLEVGRNALRRVPHLSTYERRERAISTLVTPLALHALAVALVTGADLREPETTVLRALGGGGGHEPIPGQGDCLHRPTQGSPRLPGDAHAVRAPALANLGGPATGSHASLHPGHVGIARPPTRDGPSGARTLDGGHTWVELSRGLVVLRGYGARKPPASSVGAPPLGPAPGPGQPPLPCLTPRSGARSLSGAWETEPMAPLAARR